MNTTKTQLQYITAALMFLLLAVFLIDNPIKGIFEETNAHQGLALYMCIFYAITTAWFWNNTLDQKTKSKIFVIGAVIGLAGVIGQFISYNMDFKEYKDAIDDALNGYAHGRNWDFEIYEETYPINAAAWQNIIAGCAFASYLALLGVMCGKAQNKRAKYALFATMAIMLFFLICPHLPLEKSSVVFGEDWEAYHKYRESHVESRENVQFISTGLLFLSWALTMLLYKYDEPVEEVAAAEEATEVETEVQVEVEETVVVEVAEEPAEDVAEEIETPVEEKVEQVEASTNSTLASGTALQDGRYMIDSVLDHGNFAVTYLATQTSLNRKVVIKEFFMKEYCYRDNASKIITKEAAGSMDIVAKFKEMFIKEAQAISELQNHNIATVYDIFEENGTSYYVMESK